jgi:hypothetical protein
VIRILRLLTAAVLALALFGPAAPAYSDQASKGPNCEGHFDRGDWHRQARVVYSGQREPSTRQRAKLALRFRCQARPRSRLILRRHELRYRRHHLQRLELIRLTPYDCGAIGRFAVPCWIIMRESRGRWGAANTASTAVGPYQMLDLHGRPWPIRSAADRLAHHRIAAHLWAGGAGCSHWSAC